MTNGANGTINSFTNKLKELMVYSVIRIIFYWFFINKV